MQNTSFKSKIRKTKEWQQLRQRVAALFDNKDAITNEPLRKGWNLHHVDQDVDHYADFNITTAKGLYRFLPLNRTTHELIHSLYRSKHRKHNPLDIITFFNNMQQRIIEMDIINTK